jgi:hypothetical protein
MSSNQLHHFVAIAAALLGGAVAVHLVIRSWLAWSWLAADSFIGLILFVPLFASVALGVYLLVRHTLARLSGTRYRFPVQVLRGRGRV